MLTGVCCPIVRIELVLDANDASKFGLVSASKVLRSGERFSNGDVEKAKTVSDFLYRSVIERVSVLVCANMVGRVIGRKPNPSFGRFDPQAYFAKR